MSMVDKDMVIINNINSLNSNLVVTPMDTGQLTQKIIQCNKICNFSNLVVASMDSLFLITKET